MAQDHYMPLFVGDFLAATATWSGPERGLYLQLLMLQWSTKTLPADTSRLARVMHYSPDEFQALWPVMADKFVVDGLFMVNRRLEQHRTRTAELQEIRRLAGLKGAEARWQTDGKSGAVANGKGNGKNMPSDPIHSESEQKLGGKKVPSEPLSGKPDLADSIRKVFEHWQDAHHKPRARLDEKRKRLIRVALGAYSEADLCQSISGYLNSPHHMGRNDRDTVYNDIGLLLRDSQHIDAGLQFYANPPRANLSKQTRDIIDNTAGWVPPELRERNNEH